MNTIPASFHDGLLLFVQAVTETLAHGGTVTDGEGITQRMWNRSFQGQGLEEARTACLGVHQAGGREEPLILRLGQSSPHQSPTASCRRSALSPLLRQKAF